MLYPEVELEKILVAHLGVDTSFFGIHPWLGPPVTRPYFLYVGQRSNYKNFRRLLEAFGESGLASRCDLRVISSEHGGFTAEEHSLITHYGLEQAVQLVSRVCDAELAAYYQHSLALVYPSEYEGFGLPIVEAMAAGTLVITSDRASMPEVGGDVAFYVDPYCVADLARRLNDTIVLPAAERARRIAAGVTRAQLFSWERFDQVVVGAMERLLAL